MDIGSSAVKAVQLDRTGPAVSLKALGVVELPPGAISEGTIHDLAAVVDAIQHAVSKAGIKTTDAAIGICGRELMIKKLQIPEVPARELPEAVHLEAEHQIPFAIDEVFLDYHVLGQQDRVLELALVAAKKTKVTEYANAVQEAGLSPVVVDVDGFALGNQFEMNAPEETGLVALVDIGATMMKINVVRGGTTLFVRDVPFGGNRYTETIAARLKIPFAQAEAAKLGREGGFALEALAPVRDAVSRELALELQRAFDYFASTAATEQISKMVLAGGTSKLVGLREYLGSTFGVPVEVVKPFEHVQVAPEHAQEVAAAGPSLAVAVGLGLRQPGDSAKR
ncbi:MAG: type IV pilus assembly protein PilM [Candidatus Rokubacteria bacterium]|nr:type IV pilus assembly protein PilM [Candidatus Rokubacteria bacterium]MBI3825551.1 type IV pilus assembly protein PilM [Candidatus Rokubacteria bacterium]